MDPAIQSQWDAWCRALIGNALKEHDLYEARLHNELVTDVEREFDAVFEQINALRTRLRIVESVIRGEIAALPTKPTPGADRADAARAG